MKKRIITILALAMILIVACLMLVSCDQTIKDNGGATIVEVPKVDNNNTDNKDTIKKYILTVNNGTGVKNYTYEEGTSVTVNADEIDKTFICWEFEAVQVSTETSYSFKINNDVTITAIYADSYKVYLDAGVGDVASSSVSAFYGYKYSLPVPQLENHYFLGWYYGGKAYTDNKGVALENFAEESYIILEAKYQEKPLFAVNITNGDSDDLITETLYYHLDEAVTIKALAVTDRLFKGWIDENEETISTDSSYTFVVKSELTFVAKYVEAYKVEVSGGRGSGTYEKNTEITIAFNSAASGKEFVGWKISGETEIFTTEKSFNHIVLSGIKFEAVTERKLYTLTYKVDGVIDGLVENYYYNDDIVARIEPQKEHYTFSSWIGLLAKMPAKDIVVEGIFTLDRVIIEVINGTGGGNYGWGTSVTIRATEPEGKSFVRWVDTTTEALVSESNPYTFTLETYKSLTAEFSNINYTLSYFITVVGEDLNNLPAYLTGEPKSVAGLYASFTLIYKQNTKDLSKDTLLTCEHYKTFSGWSDVPTQMPSHNVTITGTFTIQTHTVSVTGGTISGGGTAGVFNYNSPITFTANIPTGWEFVNWKIGNETIVSVQNPYSFSVKQDGAYTAVIKMTEFFLRYFIKASYEDNFVIHVEQMYYYGETVGSLTAPTRLNHYFGNWSEIPQAMPASDVRVEGIFYLNKHTITVTGGLIIKHKGNNVTPTASATYEYGDSVTVLAMPKIGDQFKDWATTGGRVVSTESEYTFILDKSLTLTASSTQKNYTLTYILDNNELEPYAENIYVYDQVISLLIDPVREHYHFSGWTLLGGGSVPSRMPDNNLVCYGELIIDEQTVVIDYGTITKVNGVALQTPISNGTYNHGTELTIVANVPNGKWFKKWITQYAYEEYNVVVTPYAGYNGEYNYTLAKNIHLTAIFEASKHTVTINNDSGKINGLDIASATFDYNTPITITNKGGIIGKRYVEIKKDGVKATVDTQYTFNIVADTAITVVYEYIQYEVKYVLNGGGYSNYEYSKQYHIYTDVINTLAPPPDVEHYHFGGWQLIGFLNFPAIIRDLDHNVVINGEFIIDTHTISLTKGKITKKNGDALDTFVTSGTYDYNTNLTIVADTFVGQYFDKWEDASFNTLTTNSVYDFALTSNASFTAVNKYYDYEVKYYVSGATYGEDTPYLESNYIYHYDDTINYLASPSVINDYVFIGWYLLDYSAVPTKMPDVNGKLLKVFGRYEHIFTYSLTLDQESYSIAKNADIDRDIYPSEIVIPSSYQGMDITEISPSGFINLDITSIIINNNILTIGASAFSNCTSLVSISLPFIGKTIVSTGLDGRFKYIFGTVPSSLTTIVVTDDLTVSDYAFDGLNAVQSITLPQTVTSIGSYAFNNCSSIVVINIPATLTTLGNYAFSGCSSVNSINYNATNLSNLLTNNNVFNLSANELTILIGSTVTTIPNYLFCPVPINVDMPSKVGESVTIEFLSDGGNYLVTSIGAYAFSGINASTILLPNTITTLGDYAFYYSTLSSIEINNNIVNIGTHALANMSNVSITYATNIVSTVDANTKLFEGTTGTVVIGNNVTKINSYLFLNASIGSVSFASTSICTTIENFAFAENAVLNSVEIPLSITTVGNGAFANATHLAVINFYASNLANFTASTDAFSNCGFNVGLVVNIGSLVTRIPEYMFYSSLGSSANVTSVTLASDGVCTEIGKYAFNSLRNLTSVGNFEFVKTIGTSAFENCNKLASFTISAVTKTIEAKAFKNCTVLTFNCEAFSELKSWSEDWNQGNYPVSYSVNNISNSDYQYVLHKNLVYITRYIGETEDVIVPQNIDTYLTMCIGNAFENNALIETVSLPINITSIIDYAFSNCSSLTTLTYTGEITYLGKYAFNNCANLATFSIPSYLTIIYEGTFKDCASLISSAITPLDLSNILSIQKSAFNGCSSIEVITLPTTITEIYELTFAYCIALSSIYIPQSVTEIADDAFFGCTNITFYDVDANNLYYSSEDGVLFDKDKYVVICYPAGNLQNSYSIPSTVKAISAYAFCSAVNLETITIPESVTYFGMGAFGQCVNLTTINYNAISALADDLCVFIEAGSNSTGINIIVGNAVIDIPNNLFGSEGIFITALTLGSSVKSIGQNAFIGADIVTLTIPKSVITIGNNAFKDNTKLSTINYNATSATNLLAENGAFAFAGLDGSGITVNIGSDVTAIPNYLFSKGTAYQLNIIVVNFSGSSLLTIGKYSFYGAKLTTITIIESVITLGEKAFGDNKFVETLNFNATNITNNLSTDNVFSNLGSELAEGIYIEVTIGATVKNIPDYFNYNLSKVISVDIVSTVLERVGKYAFKGTSIVEISLPDTVTDIGENAFENLAFTTLNLPADIKNIGAFAFKGMSNIASLTLPIGLQTIGESAFASLNLITTITIPISVIQIGINAFSGATSLTNINYNAINVADNKANKAFTLCGEESSPVTVNIGSLVERIPNYLFTECNYIYTVIFSGNTVCHTISEKAFYMLSNLQSVVDMPSSVTTIGTSAFEQCTLLEDISLTAISGNLIVGDSAFRECSSLSTITFADNSTLFSIGSYAFYNCILLETVTFGINSVLKAIGEYAFANCVLLDLVLPESIAEYIVDNNVTQGIGRFAFDSCPALTNVTIPSGVSYIFEGTFKNCTALTSLTVHDNIVYIGDNAFENCTSLLGIVVPEKTIYIGASAFKNCTAVSTLYYYPTATDITTVNNETNETFSNLGSENINGTALTFGATVKYIPNYLFYGTSESSPNLTSITFATSANMSGVASIGKKAFYYAEHLQSLVLPEGLQTINSEAFAHCSLLENLTIPSSVTLIKSKAFGYAYKLTDIAYNAVDCEAFINDFGVSIDKTDVFIGAGTYSDEFYTNEGIALTIGNSVERLPERMFFSELEMSKLKTIAFETYGVLSSIGKLAFSEQTALTTITEIPETIIFIGERAFYDCKNLVSDMIMRNATTVANEAFYNCSSLTKLHLSEELSSLGMSGAYMNCSSVIEVNVYTVNLPKESFSSFNSIFKGVGRPVDVNGIYGDSDGFVLNIGEDVEYIPNHFMHNFEVFGSNGEIEQWTLNINQIVINNDNLIIGDYAFSGINKLQTLTLGSIEEGRNIQIGNYAFFNCPDLVTVTLNNVTMGYNNENLTTTESTHIFAFSSLSTLKCTNLAVIPFIAKYAFYGCANLSVINPDHSVDIVPAGEDYTWHYLDAKIQSIGEYAFAGSGLIDVYLSSEVSEIKAHAFENCLSLTTFRWPERVGAIGAYAFSNCSALSLTTFLHAGMSNLGTDMTSHYTQYLQGLGTIIGPTQDTLIIGDGDALNARGTSISEIGEFAFYNTLLNISVSVNNNLSFVDVDAFSGMNGILSGEENLPIEG